LLASAPFTDEDCLFKSQHAEVLHRAEPQ
jgi:hypothetical protein